VSTEAFGAGWWGRKWGRRRYHADQPRTDRARPARSSTSGLPSGTRIGPVGAEHKDPTVISIRSSTRSSLLPTSKMMR